MESKMPPVAEDVFGKITRTLKNGNQDIDLIRRFTLSNQNGMFVQVINYGATITSLNVPDKNGKMNDVVLGFDTFEDYVRHPCYFGATIGRYANRIANGKFKINNKEFNLCRNEVDCNHLHGGQRGFDKLLWESHVEGSLVIFTHRSLAKEEGYPGTITAQVSFEVTPENELVINYKVKDVTESTPINMTNHSYFNLAGHNSHDIQEHEIKIYADSYLPVNKLSIPTGEIAQVDGTLFDLREPTKLSNLSEIAGGGYDHNFCINSNLNPLKPVARVFEPTSGRSLSVYSNQPGVQFYTANFLPTDNSLKGKGGAIYQKHSAFCLETQNYPDAINQPNFPNCLIGPGDTYNHKTVFKFSTN